MTGFYYGWSTFPLFCVTNFLLGASFSYGLSNSEFRKFGLVRKTFKIDFGGRTVIQSTVWVHATRMCARPLFDCNAHSWREAQHAKWWLYALHWMHASVECIVPVTHTVLNVCALRGCMCVRGEVARTVLNVCALRGHVCVRGEVARTAWCSAQRF